MSEPALTFVDAAHDDVVQRAYDTVFRPAFDPTELPDISSIVPTSTRLLLVAVDGPTVVAGAVVDTYRPSSIGLLSYLATRPVDRSRGLGAKLLGALRTRWTRDRVDLVLAEVRDPRVWETSDAERPGDRLRFYARTGCQLLPVPWVQPAHPFGDGMFRSVRSRAMPRSVAPASVAVNRSQTIPASIGFRSQPIRT